MNTLNKKKKHVASTEYKSGAFQTLDKGVSLKKWYKNLVLTVIFIACDWKRKERGTETGVIPELQDKV
jgi:hypothetical protein